MDIKPAVQAISPYLNDWLEFQASSRRLPGLQVAVRCDGELICDVAWGVADETTGEAMTADHLFRIASHSKTFTATAVMQLVEREQLRLDDPIGQWVPQLREADATIADVTIRELLGHLSGVIRDSADADFWQRLRPFPDLAGLLHSGVEDGAVYQPNQHFKYSNIGYGLLGLVIEAASGQTYADYLGKHVLGPLGLERTGADYDPDRAGEYAAGHTGLLDAADTRTTISHVHTAALAPATGMYSTARELTRYLAAHTLGNEQLLTDRSKRVMQRVESVIYEHGQETGRYGVGMSVGTVGKRQMVGHGGAYPGQITRSYLDPEDGLAVSVLTNAIDGPAEALAKGVVSLIDLALTPPKNAQPVPPEAGPLETYTGRFANLWGVGDVVDLAGRLVVVRPEAPDPVGSHIELVPVDRDHARQEEAAGFGPVGEPVTYSRDATGAITAARFGGATFWPINEFRKKRSSLAQDNVSATDRQR